MNATKTNKVESNQTCMGDDPELSEGLLRTGLLLITSGCFALSFLVEDDVDRIYDGI